MTSSRMALTLLSPSVSSLFGGLALYRPLQVLALGRLAETVAATAVADLDLAPAAIGASIPLGLLL